MFEATFETTIRLIRSIYGWTCREVGLLQALPFYELPKLVQIENSEAACVCVRNQQDAIKGRYGCRSSGTWCLKDVAVFLSRHLSVPHCRRSEDIPRNSASPVCLRTFRFGNSRASARDRSDAVECSLIFSAMLRTNCRMDLSHWPDSRHAWRG